MHTDRCGNTHRQKCCTKGSGKEVKIQEFVYRDTTNVEPELYDCTSNNWSHWNSNEKFKEKFGNYELRYSSTVQALRLCTDRTAHRGSRGIAVLYRY